ncbi:hypothetical protein TNIN_407171 [Trichonephila inaurata madagascariensis]|uniref:Uncharacterized protein n=1 Tax=Trichonephila inaurata madagascariensis TaxID=2747483 RepID=A0A8X7CK39_9ARAC|nr:hypothetical protein TNIN_407171 [Trichonephila inaurata madagascariensis]
MNFPVQLTGRLLTDSEPAGVGPNRFSPVHSHRGRSGSSPLSNALHSPLQDPLVLSQPLDCSVVLCKIRLSITAFVFRVCPLGGKENEFM